MKLDRRDTIRMLGAGALAMTGMPFARAARPRSERPNFLFFITDDQAQSALSCYGNSILKTPHMDRIGDEGVRFNQAFVTNSLCAPSRASFLTGLYSHSHGVTTNGEESGWYEQQGIARDQATWPQLLREGGYASAVVGKWHLKSLPFGFDHFAILPGQGEYFDPAFIVNGEQVRLRGHTDDVIADQALAWLRHRPTDKPFCLLCQFKAPHRPWQAASRFNDEFTDVKIPIPPAFERLPESVPEPVLKTQMSVAEMVDFNERGVGRDLPPAKRKYANLQTFVKNYYRTLLGVDENVGRVLDFLDREKLAENTAVIYTSDNGFFLGEFGLYDKRLMYEPSIKIPMLMRWPARIEPKQVDDDHMVLNVDVAPTLLDIGGAAIPKDLQGRSWLPVLENRNAAWRDAFLYEFYEYPAVHCVRKHRGVRTKNWKLIHFWEQPEEYALYDLANDPDELVNLAQRPEHAQRMTQLKARLLELRHETDDRDPPGYTAPKVQPGRCPA
jgi:arylsulfatase A-like enzyme